MTLTDESRIVSVFLNKGKLSSHDINGTSTAFFSQVLIETTSQNNVTNRYTYGYSRINQERVDSTSYYVYNNLGRSVTALMSSTGQVLNDYEYDSFGNIKTKPSGKDNGGVQ